MTHPGRVGFRTPGVLHAALPIIRGTLQSTHYTRVREGRLPAHQDHHGRNEWGPAPILRHDKEDVMSCRAAALLPVALTLTQIGPECHELQWRPLTNC